MLSFDSTMLSMDSLLDFSSDVGEGDNDDEEDEVVSCGKEPSLDSKARVSAAHHREREREPQPQPRLRVESDSDVLQRGEEEEEELEWISNQDAFPSIDTFEIFAVSKHQSPVSVLESSSSGGSSSNSSNCNNSYKRARSKRRRRSRSSFPSLNQQWWRLFQANKKRVLTTTTTPTATTTLGPATGAGGVIRKCTHCLAEKTPQWRAGPLGPKTLCNACGVRYKSGRLVQEYRPASSPTFSTAVHSNSHRKILEMRRKKQHCVEKG